MVDLMKDLPGSALAVYRREKKNETLQYFPSEAYREPNDLHTEIRICPSLTEKPGKDDDEAEDKSEEQKQKEKEEKPDDVFDSQYWGPLLVKEFDAGGESFGFLLNMNAVVPMHSIIVTKHFEHQYKSASAAQLLAAYTVLASLRSVPVYEQDGKSRTGGGQFVAFFNCNKLSGASQPHKHLQFLPLDGEDGLGDFPIERAARSHKKGQQLRESFSVPSLPYVHFVKRLSLPEASDDLANYLHQTYTGLLDEMVETLQRHPDCKSTALDVEDGLSYNVIMTDEHMHVIPRRDDTFVLREPESEGSNKASTEPEELSVNSIAYCGTVLVKDERDDRRLRKLGGVLAVLEHCGFSRSKLKHR